MQTLAHIMGQAQRIAEEVNRPEELVGLGLERLNQKQLIIILVRFKGLELVFDEEVLNFNTGILELNERIGQLVFELLQFQRQLGLLKIANGLLNDRNLPYITTHGPRRV